MSGLLKKLSPYGFNFSEVMKRFDDEDFYMDCLVEFIYDSSFVGLKESIDKKNYKDAFYHAHTLKGVAGNLGLMSLYSSICEIVEALRIQDYTNISQLYGIILAEQIKLQEIIGSNTL